VSIRVTTGIWKPVGELHHTNCLAIAFRAGGAEIVMNPGLGVMTLFLTDQGDRLTAKPCETCLNCRVLGEFAVACERHELIEQGFGVIFEMRTGGVPGDLGFLPGRKPRIDLRHGVAGAGFEPADLLAGIDAFVFGGKFPQFKNLAFQIGDRFFEIKVIVH
jgi:hypothetical protein